MNFDDYKVTVNYPLRPKTLRHKPSDDLAPEMASRYAYELEQWSKEMVEWKAKMKLYEIASQEATNRFKKDVLKEYGLENHPKAEEVYAFAWQEGHAYGLSEVAIWVSKLADLVK
jgi:hypothetical protein